MHGSPFWGVSIAFAHNGQVVFGLVFCPELDFLYEAFNGKGAYLNGNLITVSKIALLEHSLITSGITHNLKKETEKKEKKLKMFLKLFEKAQRLRILGSSVLQICEVAAGHSEAFVGTGLKAWDFAAANKILEEAGGKTSTMNNQPVILGHQDMICSNGLIHDQLLELVDR
jgi:myo-inositol-1(or 4)-monophosphatase